MQVLALSPEQIENLPPSEREAIKQLVRTPFAACIIDPDLEFPLQRSQFLGMVHPSS